MTDGISELSSKRSCCRVGQKDKKKKHKKTALFFIRRWFCYLLSSLLSSGRVSSVFLLWYSLCSDNPGRCELPSMPPLAPESVSCPDTHRQTRTHHLISGAAVIAESTICSDPACSKVGGATHLDPWLPILPRLLLFIYFILSPLISRLHHIGGGFNSPSSFTVLINHTLPINDAGG